MSTVSSITSGSSTPTSLTGSTTTVALPQKTLGQDDFLKLLAQQFQAQDPLQPMDNTAFIAQMAQFSSLQQSSDMDKNITSLLADQQKATANSYLGHRVTVNKSDGTMDTGDVTSIDLSGTTPQLMVNGTGYPVSAVVTVEPGALSTTSTPAPATTTTTTTTP